jgi:hypothetical protein
MARSGSKKSRRKGGGGGRPSWVDPDRDRLREQAEAWRDLAQRLDDEAPPAARVLRARADLADARLGPGTDVLAREGAAGERFNRWADAEAALADAHTALVEGAGRQPSRTFGVVEHQAWEADDHVPHVVEQCGVCAAAKSGQSPRRVELRYGPLREDVLPFGLYETLLRLDSWVPDPQKVIDDLPPPVREMAGGLVFDLDIDTLVPGALEAVGVGAWLDANGIRNRIREIDRAPEEEESGPAPDRAPVLRDELARLELRYHVFRWAATTLAPPTQADWDRADGWPTREEVESVYRSFDELLRDSGIESTRLADAMRSFAEADEQAEARLAEADEALARAEAHEKEIGEALAQAEGARREQLEEEAARARLEKVEAQLEAARREAAVADGERRSLSRRLEEETARARATEEELRGALADAERRAGAAPRAPTPHVGGDGIAERDELIEALRRQVGELSHEVARVAAGTQAPAREEDEDEPPDTVLEATRRAAARAQHLVYADGAFESAADSPYRRPQEILDALDALDVIAGEYARPEGIGKAIADRARELGLTWKGGVGDMTVSRNRDAYTVTHDGRRFTVGPHVNLGGGSGAGLIARIYLVAHEGDDELPRSLIVGLVGRHLPDSTTD